MSDDYAELIGEVSVEEAAELFRLYHHHATNQKGPGVRALMSIPVDFRRDADVRLAAFIRQAGRDRARLAKLEAVVERARALARCERAQGADRAWASPCRLHGRRLAEALDALDALGET